MAGLLNSAQNTLMGLLNTPTKVQQFLTNPQAFLGLLGQNRLPNATGFAAGATGLPMQTGSVLDPNQVAYERGYSSGEPVGYAAMASPMLVPAARALAPKAGQMAENYMMQQGMMPTAVAYHGTPHTIQGKFDINKVGTGEGAQAYGHGMYFAENPKVATEYRKSLSGRTDFNELPSDSAYAHAVESFRQANYPLEQIPAEMKKAYKDITDKDIKLAIQSTEKGNLYKVDIPDENIPNMLDWDKPLSKMTKKEAAIIEPLKQALISRNNPYDPKSFETIGQVIQSSRGTNPNLEKQLLEAGIPGIKYLDEGSRDWRILTPKESTSGKYVVGKWPGGGKEQKYFDNAKEAQDYFNQNQTSNHVVFDPSTVKILEKNNNPIEGLLD
jgi:hypothetical protein